MLINLLFPIHSSFSRFSFFSVVQSDSGKRTCNQDGNCYCLLLLKCSSLCRFFFAFITTIADVSGMPSSSIYFYFYAAHPPTCRGGCSTALFLSIKRWLGETRESAWDAFQRSLRLETEDVLAKIFSQDFREFLKFHVIGGSVRYGSNHPMNWNRNDESFSSLIVVFESWRLIVYQYKLQTPSSCRREGGGSKRDKKNRRKPSNALKAFFFASSCYIQ